MSIRGCGLRFGRFDWSVGGKVWGGDGEADRVAMFEIDGFSRQHT